MKFAVRVILVKEYDNGGIVMNEQRFEILELIDEDDGV